MPAEHEQKEHSNDSKLPGDNVPGLNDELWQRTFDAVADPLFILDINGVIRQSNRASIEFLSKTKGAIIGSHCFEQVHKTTSFIPGCPFVKSGQTGIRESYQLKMRDRWYRITVDPLKDETGTVIGAIHIITDIDELLKVQEIRAMLGVIIEKTHDAVISMAPDGTVGSWNRGAEEIFGYRQEEISGESILTLVPQNEAETLRSILTAVAADTAVSQDITMYRKDGERREVTLSASPVTNDRGVISGAAFIIRDISLQRNAERALVSYIGEAAMRLKTPVSVIRNNLADIRVQMETLNIDHAEAALMLAVQIAAADQVIENIRELDRVVSDAIDTIPEQYKKFLKS